MTLKPPTKLLSTKASVKMCPIDQGGHFELYAVGLCEVWNQETLRHGLNKIRQVSEFDRSSRLQTTKFRLTRLTFFNDQPKRDHARSFREVYFPGVPINEIR